MNAERRDAAAFAKKRPHKQVLEHSTRGRWRQRKFGVRAEDGSVIAFPYMPRVAELPPGWRHFSAAQKIEHLIGLDRCYEILSWPWAGLDPLRRSFRMQVIRVLLPIGIKAMLRWHARPRSCPRAHTRGRASSVVQSRTHPCTPSLRRLNRPRSGKTAGLGGVAGNCGTASETARDFWE
jgi:hypothetical protein